MECMNLLLPLLEHGKRCVAVVKKPRTSKKGQDLLLGANSPFKNVPLLNMKQTVNIVPLLYILQIGN